MCKTHQWYIYVVHCKRMMNKSDVYQIFVSKVDATDYTIVCRNHARSYIMQHTYTPPFVAPYRRLQMSARTVLRRFPASRPGGMNTFQNETGSASSRWGWKTMIVIIIIIIITTSIIIIIIIIIIISLLFYWCKCELQKQGRRKLMEHDVPSSQGVMLRLFVVKPEEYLTMLK